MEATIVKWGVILELNTDNGKQITSIIGYIMGLYGDSRKENGCNYSIMGYNIGALY